MLACSLSEVELRERRNLVRKELLPEVLSVEEGDLQLDITFPAASLSKVEEFVSLEQQCCGFMSFDIDSAGDPLKLTISAPENGRETLKLFIAALAG